MEFLQLFGERVRRARMRLGLSQTECARLAQMPIAVLSRIEHGRQSIYLDRLVALLRTLNVSPEYLLGFRDDPTPLPPQKETTP